MSMKYTTFDKDELENLYFKEGLSQRQIANLKGVTHPTIRRAFRFLNIQSRTRSEASKMSRHGFTILGSGNPNWRGGKRISKDGYIRIYAPDHPRATHSRYVSEHILIWEQVHNRRLPQNWVVHHLNGIKNDNRPENLVAMARGRHIGLAEPFKKRIRELEAKVKILEHALSNEQMIWWSEN